MTGKQIVIDNWYHKRSAGSTWGNLIALIALIDAERERCARVGIRTEVVLGAYDSPEFDAAVAKILAK
jgi:hypothetical protein